MTTAETVTTERMECVKHGNNVRVETVTTAETITTGRMECVKHGNNVSISGCLIYFSFLQAQAFVID